jgi:hypothetical protein
MKPKTKYQIRNKQTGHVYLDNAKSFGEAVEASRLLKAKDVEMVKTTEEIIYFYNDKRCK